MGSFMAVGIALQTIKERKLYREGFKTFEDYCRAKWAMGRTYAHYLVNGSQVVANLFTRVNILQPINEKQIRPLTVLEPEQQCEVWEEAVRSADGKIVTFKQVKALVKELTAPAPEPNPPSASHSGFAYSGPPRRAPFASPTPLPLGAPFRGHGGAVSGPQRRRFIFPGGSGGASQVAGDPGGQGFLYPNHMEKLTEGRIVARSSLSLLPSSWRHPGESSTCILARLNGNDYICFTLTAPGIRDREEEMKVNDNDKENRMRPKIFAWLLMVGLILTGYPSLAQMAQPPKAGCVSLSRPTAKR
jgi:hypothetical protein